MAAEVMGAVFRIPAERMASNEKFVLLALADHCDIEGRSIYPSVQTLAEKTSLSKRCVQSKLKSLKDTGILIEEKPATPISPTIYAIDLKMMRRLIDGTQDAGGVQDLHPVQDVQGRGEPDAQRGEPVAPKSPSNPQGKRGSPSSKKGKGKKKTPPPPAPPRQKDLTTQVAADGPTKGKKGSSAAGEAVKKQDGTSAKRTWLSDYDDIYFAETGGHMNMGQAAKCFKILEQEHGRELTLHGWKVHCLEESKYASPGHYAKKPKVWMPSQTQLATVVTDLSGVTD